MGLGIEGAGIGAEGVGEAVMTIGSLFSGVGGLERGLEMAGLGRVVWQCERDEFRRGVLARHWPEAERYEDVTTLSQPPAVDVVCGGFPCRDVSSAHTNGAAAGLAGEHSGLWHDYARIVSEIRPRWVIVENIYNQWRRWVPVVRGDLWRLGYASVPVRVCASDVGAPHHRPRVFVVANTNTDGESLRAIHAEASRVCAISRRARSHWRVPFTGPVVLDDGVPGGVGAVRAYGDAVVPQAAEVVGRAIVEASCS